MFILRRPEEHKAYAKKKRSAKLDAAGNPRKEQWPVNGDASKARDLLDIPGLPDQVFIQT